MKNIINYLFLCSVSILMAQNYQSAESVEFDPVNGQWLVANGSRIIIDDGEGNLSYFGTGNASHGMEVLGNTLFAVASGRIKGYDLSTEGEIMNLEIPGIGFLNGLTNDGANTLYVTDFSAGKIYSIDVTDVSNPTYAEIVSSTGGTPNGVLFDGDNNRLLFVTWGGNAQIKAVDLGTNQVSTIITTSLANIDGIDDDSDGNYYISSWSPARITKYNNDFTVSEIVDTPGLNSPADIGYSQSTDVLGIPMGSNVIFVDLSLLSTNDQTLNTYEYIVSSNPVNENSYVQFTLQESETIDINIYDASGKLVKTIFNGELQANTHKISLAGLQLSSGIYFSKLTTRKGISLVKKLIVN
ncbi:MAG: T9SS type A sorting domain-containing protein [Flavobacteriaceae bacterium]|nr:T9SS type A sorting domain-containing protein [Flavobacteriaceae bacterium]